MEPEGSLPHSQEPATCPYPEPYQSSPCPPSHLLKKESFSVEKFLLEMMPKVLS
jgi:hypothetical protein